MRYNPPPNWPQPPEGWVPPADWSPDPSWPPPPPGWKFWVDDVAVSQTTDSVLQRPERSRDDVEYFGDDRAWSQDSGQVPPHDHLNVGAAPASLRPTEVAPEDLSVQHLGRRATIRWDSAQRYDLGTIVGVSADSAAITVKLAGVETPVSFLREVTSGGPANPRLYVWI